MSTAEHSELRFESQSIAAKFIDPSGQIVEKRIEIRTHPITGRTCRIAFSRTNEKEAGTDSLPQPPPDADKTWDCPFCRPQVDSKTPQLHPDLSAGYLKTILHHDPEAVYMAITQNHLPSAGGSLVHPHLQINADRIAGNHHRFLLQKANDFHRRNGKSLFSSYLDHEKNEGSRHIGSTGAWEWMAAFAPEGFFEIWGILPGLTSLQQLEASDWQDLARKPILEAREVERQLRLKSLDPFKNLLKRRLLDAG